MPDFDMLATVKAALGIGGTYQDATLQVYIAEINDYLTCAGVPSALIGTEATAGAVARGVADIWQYGSGEGKLSSYFYERVTQLALTTNDESESDG
jgi:hypothetical protein